MSLFGDNIALERLERRLAQIEDDCADLQRENRKLGLEYIELYDKVRHQMSRMAKRDALSVNVSGEDLVVATDADSPDPISAKILALRGEPRAAT